MSRNIFISYRRADSEGLAGRIYDRLAERFGGDRVFLDVTNISVGEDFVDAIGQAISSCQVVLVIIGPRWASITDEMGRKRLEDPNDFVRLEVLSALERDVRVVPVLVHGAEMPSAEDLPSELESITRRNAFDIRHRHFDTDVNSLVDQLAESLDDGEGISQVGHLLKTRQIPVWGWILVAAAIIAFGFGIFWWQRQSENARQVEVSALETKSAAASLTAEMDLPTDTPEPPTATATIAPSTTSLPPTNTNTPSITPTPTITFTPTKTPYPTEALDALGVTMVLVPGGPFTLGTDGYDPWDIVAQPAQEITLPAYYIDKFEVSNDQYARCVEANQCDIPTNLRSRQRGSYFNDPQFADYPVIYVSWSNASAYCSWRGGRLPSEAEWEKAARSDDERPYPWGEDQPTCQAANFWPTGPCEGDTLPVNSKPNGASPYGAYNMSGNVAEWVHAWFSAYPGGDPTASQDYGKSYRVIRGGTFFDSANFIRSTVRKGLNPDDVQSFVGFRCVVDLANIP